MLAGKRPAAMGYGGTLVSEQAVRPDNTLSLLRPVLGTHKLSDGVTKGSSQGLR